MPLLWKPNPLGSREERCQGSNRCLQGTIAYPYSFPNTINDLKQIGHISAGQNNVPIDGLTIRMPAK